MPDTGLPNEVRNLIAGYIESVEKLEVLLLLFQTPEKRWTVDQVYQIVQSSRTSIGQKLNSLGAEGFLTQDDGCYWFSAKTQELSDAVKALNESYQTRRIKVIESIFSKGTDELRRFADAFRFRQDNP